MNNATNEVKFERNCFLFGEQFTVVISFPSKTLLWNNIIACAVNVIIGISTVLLNGITLMTFWRSSRIRKSACYFLLMLQSSIDFGVGIIASPLAISTLATGIAGDGRCLLGLAIRRVGILVLVFSMATLSAMHIERYMGVVHPLIHRRSVTKRKLLKYVIFVCVVYLITFFISFVNIAVYFILTGIIVVIYLALTVYVYVRIFFAASTRKAFSNSDIISDTSQRTEEERRKDVRRTQRVFLKAIKLAKSCFLVVVCMLVCYLPLICVKGLNLNGFVKWTALTWTGTLAVLNSSLNSIIFFWRNNLLRKESRDILKCICGSK